METTREVHLAARPYGEPKPSDFDVVERPMPEPAQDQVLVRNDWLSVDPYMRSRMNEISNGPVYQLGRPLYGAAVGTVVASRAAAIPEGVAVLHDLGWREHALADADQVTILDPALGPVQAHLGILGTTGLTAYVGLTRIAALAAGETVFVSGAAGAVGLAAGQLARKLGAARVIGSAGGKDKAGRLVAEFGYDAGVDYRAGDVVGQLAAAAPEGIDVYFDNVGGPQLEAALWMLRPHGRVVLCGASSVYNATEPPPGPVNLLMAIGRRLTLRGFNVSDHREVAAEYVPLAAAWLRDGSLRGHETVVDGFCNAVDAFIGLLRGANIGKMLVRL